MKKKNDATAMAREAMASVSKSRTTLNQEAVMNYVAMFLNFIFADFAENHKRLYTPEAQLREDAVAEMRKEMAEQTFGSDRSLLNACYTSLSKYLWNRTNLEEGEYVKKRLTDNDMRFAHSFFYGNSASTTNIGRIRSRLIMEMEESYGEKLTDREVGNIIYLALWKEGTWQPLSTFKAQSSIFSWIGTIARHAVVSALEEDGRIKVERERTVANVRLDKNKLTPEVCRNILDNEPLPAGIRGLIEKMYVDRLSDSQIMKQYGWDETTFSQKVKKATARLKDSMLRSPYDYDDILKDRDARRVPISFEKAKASGAWMADQGIQSSLEDLFGVNLTDAEIQDKALELMREVSARMNWSENDKIVWQRRFFENQPPEELANELNMRRYNVDNIYSRCKKRFNTAMQQWYESYTNTKVHKMKKSPKSASAQTAACSPCP